MVSPLHCAPYPGGLLADGHVEGVDVGHLGGDDGRQLRVSQFPREEGACLVGGEGRQVSGWWCRMSGYLTLGLIQGVVIMKDCMVATPFLTQVL